MTRKEIIVELVRLLPEAIDAGGGGLGEWITGGPGSRELRYGPLWYEAESTWCELTRCLILLKQERPAQYAHLEGRFHGGVEARKELRVVRRNQNVVPLGLHSHQEVRKWGGATKNKSTLDCLVHTWPCWVRARKVEAAVDFLSESFRGSPFLPVAVLAA